MPPAANEKQQQQQQAPAANGSSSRPPLRVWLSWSTGKDCAWSLHCLRQRSDVQVVGLLTTINESAGRVAMHAVRAALLQAQADAAGLPLHQVPLPSPCSNEVYEARMGAAIQAAKDAAVDAIAFGDLFLADVRAYREGMMAGTGLATLFPLWTADSGKSTAQLAAEMQAAGVKAVITCVDPKRLNPSFAGRAWDAQLLAELPPGVDPCGENGEFHTFVHEGPMLSRAIDIRLGEVVERGGFAFCDLLPPGVSTEQAAAEAAAARQAEAAAAAAAAAADAKEADKYDCRKLMAGLAAAATAAAAGEADGEAGGEGQPGGGAPAAAGSS